jgi:hypothetical protein
MEYYLKVYQVILNDNNTIKIDEVWIFYPYQLLVSINGNGCLLNLTSISFMDTNRLIIQFVSNGCVNLPCSDASLINSIKVCKDYSGVVEIKMFNMSNVCVATCYAREIAGSLKDFCYECNKVYKTT